MNRKSSRWLIALILMASLTSTVGSNLKPAFAQPLGTTGMPLGKGARVFVDKAHPAHGDLAEADFKQLADAGFSVVVNRWAKDLNGREIDIDQYVSARRVPGWWS